VQECRSIRICRLSSPPVAACVNCCIRQAIGTQQLDITEAGDLPWFVRNGAVRLVWLHGLAQRRTAARDDQENLEIERLQEE